MRKMTLGFGLATAGMVFMASHVLAQTGSGGTGNKSSDNSTMGESSGSSTTTTSDTSTTTTSDTSTTKSTALQGKVEKFDRSQKTLRLSGSDKTLHVNSSTTVMRSGESATLDDIKEGDEVRVSYSGSDHATNVKTIDIIASGSTGTSSGMGTGSSSTGASTGIDAGTANPAPPSSGSGESTTGTIK